MQYRLMSTDALKPSVIGFGGWPMGGTQYGATRDDEVTRAIQRALDAGVNLFDTAAGYGLGHSEELLGRALGGRWHAAIVVTKCGISYDAEAKVFRSDSRPASIQAACEASLRRLGTERIDIFMIHWPDYATPIDATMRALESLVQAGKIRFVGVSNFSPEWMTAARAVHPIVTNQVGYHMFDRRREVDVIPYCRTHAIGIMAYGSLAHGVLTGALSPATVFATNDWRSGGYAFGLPLFHPDHFAPNLAAVDRLRALATKAGLTLPQLALRWVLREAAVSVALVGCRTADEVDAAVAAANATVGDELLAEADAITEEAYLRMRRDERPSEDVGPRPLTSN
ncbi:MAG: aldo/keto reductase [Actinobacteria bacterium]|nr:aldo/keto reductase [Actinomycetota bacterium]